MQDYQSHISSSLLAKFLDFILLQYTYLVIEIIVSIKFRTFEKRMVEKRESSNDQTVETCPLGVHLAELGECE